MKGARAAWTMVALNAACAVATGALYLSAGLNPFTDVVAVDGFPVTTAGTVIGGLVGAVVVSRHPRHRVGWLLCAGQAGSALGLAADAVVYRTDTPAAAVVAQVFGGGWALAATFAVFLLVPDGRLPSKRWRPALGLLILGYLLGLTPVAPMAIAGVFGLVLAGVAATVALVLRLRRASGARRRQLRWIAFGAVLLAVGVVVYVVAQTAVARPPAYLVYPLYLGFAAVPVCTGIAILRYRLYDIDLIISRALVLAILAAFVTAGYIAVVVGAGALLGSHGRWRALLAFVVVALAFQPLRRRVIRLADRMVYGRRAAPYEALTELGHQLGRSLPLGEVVPALAEAVVRAVGAAHATVRVDVPELSASWPRPPDRAPEVDIEVRDRLGVLGHLALSMPAGRALRATERRLLEDFAAQAALALRNARLDAELRAQVAWAEQQGAALEASRRRLLAARDDERRRTAAVIEREVLHHLRPLPAALGEVPAAEATLRRLEEVTATAIEALREVTRGVYPSMLASQGLVAALRGHSAVARRPDVLTVGPGVAGTRFGQRTETAAYLCAVALLATTDHLTLSIEDGWLVVEAGPAPSLDEAMVDRIEAAGGRLSLVTGRVELPAQPPLAAAQASASRSVPNDDLSM